MSEKASELIRKYIQKAGVDPDASVRETAGANLYLSYLLTGDRELRRAAYSIWKEVGTHPDAIKDLIRDAKLELKESKYEHKSKKLT
jgi:hypothetical protein